MIDGDNVGLPGIPSGTTSARAAFLETIFADGPILTRFERLVAQLDVRYVVLAHTVDWRSYASWLGRQVDLDLALSSPTLTVWRNKATRPQGARLARSLAVPSSIQVYVDLAERHDLTGTAVFVPPRTPVHRHVRWWCARPARGPRRSRPRAAPASTPRSRCVPWPVRGPDCRKLRSRRRPSPHELDEGHQQLGAELSVCVEEADVVAPSEHEYCVEGRSPALD